MLKNYLSMLVLGAAVLALPACSDDDDPTPDPIEGGEMVKQGVLTENETWTAENVYILNGRVVVDEGVTLTIEPGTIIKAEDGQQSNASALIVDQGGMLIANGTASQPIIFTSVNDGIQPGETESTLELADAGQWGGLILLGRAPISVTDAGGTAYVEGIPPGLSYGEYGGDVADDNSGSLQYLSIRFSGVALQENSEIQGLTLGGVGSGTTISNIEIYSNKDDGVEWFGGTVDVENLLVYGQEDDGIDIDMAYSGTISNAFVIQSAQSGSAFEIDGPEGNMTGSFTLQNVTVDAGNFEDKLLADFRSGAMGTLENIYFYNISATGSSVNIDDDETAANYNNGEIIFNSWELVLPEGKTVADLFTNASAADISNAAFVDNVTAVQTGSVGANLSAFDWTYTKSVGAF